MSEGYTKIKVNIGGCKNCLSTVHHIIGVYCGIEKYVFNFEENLLSIHPLHAKRVINLLRFAGWDTDECTDNPDLSVCSQPNEGEESDDLYFLPHLEDEVKADFSPLCKKKRVDNDLSASTHQNPCTTASKLIAILPHEVECCRLHLVPGWCVLVKSGPYLSKINQYLQTFLPLSEKFNHIKRIDSCRSNGSGSIYVFLQIAKPSYTWLDASQTITSMIDSLNINSSDDKNNDRNNDNIITTTPTPCWLPLHAPLTRKHQTLYSCSKTSSKGVNCFSLVNSSSSSRQPIVMGWPCTLRASPELEELLMVGKDSLTSSYFTKSELERHSSWLKRVTMLSEKSTNLSNTHPQSCAGFEGPPCAAIIVNPETNVALAESTTSTATVDSSCLDHAVLLVVSAVANLKKKSEKEYSEIYLCTGLDAYVSLEPCLMCGMALLHNRIRRVFCCQRLKERGAFTNASRLHVQEQLNHRFRVFAPPS